MIGSCSNHIYKKRKDSLKTRAKLAVICTYIENQAILEPFLLYRASNCKQRGGQRRLFIDPYFYLFMRLLSAFFLFSVKMQTKQDQAVL